MSLHTNTAQRKRVRKSAKVVHLEKTREAQFSKFKSKIAVLSFTLASFTLVVGGIVYFLVGQVQLNVLNERMLKKSKKLKAEENADKCIPEKNVGRNYADLDLEMEDKVEIFQ